MITDGSNPGQELLLERLEAAIRYACTEADLTLVDVIGCLQVKIADTEFKLMDQMEEDDDEG